MAIVAPIANFAILEKLVMPGDAGLTFTTLSVSTGLLRTGIALFLLVAILDILVAWALYIFLKPVNKNLSLLAAWFRLAYAAMLAFLLVYLLHVLQLFSGNPFLTALDTGQLQAQVMLSLGDFRLGWELSLIIFGMHLLLLGILFYRAGYMRKILGVLLILASLGYLIDGFGKVLSPAYDLSISLYTFVGEIILIFWLLIAGKKQGNRLEPGEPVAA